MKTWIRNAGLALVTMTLAACGGSYEGLQRDDATGAGDSRVSVGSESAGGEAYRTQCLSCHGSDGTGTPAGPSLVGCATCGDVETLVDQIVTTMPLGDTEACGLRCSQDVASYILSAFNGSAADLSATALRDVERAPAEQVLYKAALNLTGRLPSAAEREQVQLSGDAALDTIVDDMLDEPAFYERLIEVYNDILLQNKYLGGENAIRLLQERDFPQSRWYRYLGLDTSQAGRERHLYNYLRAQTNDAVAQEVLRLIEYVVRNDRPFTEILTADYTVANYYSARAFGAQGEHRWRQLDNPEFPEFPYDPTDFRPVHVYNQMYPIPHAGVLTSPMFLNRFPTTETNRNRHRSRMIYQLFLDTDILQLGGARPGDAVDIESPIPTLDNPDCLICHEVLDPVASTFQNWNARGQYRPSHYHDGWFTDMEPRGFNGKTMDLSSDTVNASVRWLARAIVRDPRFAKSTVKTVFTALTGQVPLSAPAADVRESAPERRAYQAQTAYFADLQRRLIESGYDIKTVIRALVTGPYFAAARLSEDADTRIHAATGSARLLTPEMLSRKIQAVAGVRWDRSGRDRLTSDRNDSLRILYGGINSDDVTVRLTEPNGLMVAVQQRMAQQVACSALAPDFHRPPAQRLLFPHVEPGHSLLDAQGLINPNVEPLVRANLKHLIWVLWGRAVEPQDEDVNQLLTLLADVQRSGRAWAAASGRRDANRLHPACDLTRDAVTGENLSAADRIVDDESYMLRTWQAALVTMLGDFEFVYE